MTILITWQGHSWIKELLSGSWLLRKTPFFIFPITDPGKQRIDEILSLLHIRVSHPLSSLHPCSCTGGACPPCAWTINYFVNDCRSCQFYLQNSLHTKKCQWPQPDNHYHHDYHLICNGQVYQTVYKQCTFIILAHLYRWTPNPGSQVLRCGFCKSCLTYVLTWIRPPRCEWPAPPLRLPSGGTKSLRHICCGSIVKLWILHFHYWENFELDTCGKTPCLSSEVGACRSRRLNILF